MPFRILVTKDHSSEELPSSQVGAATAGAREVLALTVETVDLAALTKLLLTPPRARRKDAVTKRPKLNVEAPQ